MARSRIEPAHLRNSKHETMVSPLRFACDRELDVERVRSRNGEVTGSEMAILRSIRIDPEHRSRGREIRHQILRDCAAFVARDVRVLAQRGILHLRFERSACNRGRPTGKTS